MTPAVAPEPYLQPDHTKDCGYYAAAYIARCLGHGEVTAEQIKTWRAETRYHEDAYVERALGHETRRTSWPKRDDGDRRWWMGPGTRDWVRGWLDDGWIAHVVVHRIPTMGHSVVLLDHSVDGVLLMDPIYGHITEPWDWFLGTGPGTYGCHRIDAWYKRSDDQRLEKQ